MKATLNFLRKERLTDWQENGANLKQQLYKYQENYRQKICKTCIGTEQQIKRKCYVFPGFDSNGNLKRSCNHMTKAQSNKFRKKIYAHINFHPTFFNPDNRNI